MADLKIVSIGAAVQDVFLRGKSLTPTKDDDGDWVEELAMGSKADVDEIFFSTGGGATNSAVTFARQGINSLFLGQLGRDIAGEAIVKDLKDNQVGCERIIYSEEYSTGYSVILLAPGGERAILTYRGASEHYDVEQFKLEGIEADWFYVSSLAGNLNLLRRIIDYAEHRHIRVALNPGATELEQREMLVKLLPRIELLSANREEATSLFDETDLKQLTRVASRIVPNVVITDGPRGVVAASRRENQLCRGGMYEDVPVVDRTGAGDAFSSGFTAKIAMGAKLADAIVFASANATSVVSQIGAKAGILTADAELHGMDMQCEPL